MSSCPLTYKGKDTEDMPAQALISLMTLETVGISHMYWSKESASVFTFCNSQRRPQGKNTTEAQRYKSAI